MGHKEFMAEAVRPATESVEHDWGGPFGAVLTRDGEIIARGQNRVLLTGDPTAHAELETGFDDAFQYEDFQKPLDQRRIHIEQLLPELGASAYEAWETKPDRHAYGKGPRRSTSPARSWPSANRPSPTGT
ncbi:hypothetical protein [Streptomyces sp. NPDC101234]|uniref:hypothetical protein n=1 Tax=Streptomyces sp. NPDC101234 TaxID=3366138 RepID=UPI003812C37D